MVTINVYEDDLLEKIMAIVKRFVKNYGELKLYEQWYKRMVYDNVFDDWQLDPNDSDPFGVAETVINGTEVGTLEEIKQEFGDEFDEECILVNRDGLVLYEVWR